MVAKNKKEENAGYEESSDGSEEANEDYNTISGGLFNSNKHSDEKIEKIGVIEVSSPQ